MQEIQSQKSENFTQIAEPIKKFPVFLSRRAGLFYTWTCIATQLIASALYYAIAALCTLLSEEVANVVLSYASFSTQVILVGCLIVFFTKYKTDPVKAGLRKTKPIPCIVGVLFCASLQFTTSPFESLFETFLNGFGYETSNVIADIPMSGGLIFLALFMIALLPAFAEELIFRGVILESTKKTGTLQACLINGVLFSLFHCNPSQTCYTFLMGAGYALIAIRCNSVLPTVIAHFLNNAYSVLMLYFNVTYISDEIAALIVVAAFACTIGGLIYFLKRHKDGDEPISQSSVPLWKGATGGLIFNGIVWLLIFVMTIFEF